MGRLCVERGKRSGGPTSLIERNSDRSPIPDSALRRQLCHEGVRIRPTFLPYQYKAVFGGEPTSRLNAQLYRMKKAITD